MGKAISSLGVALLVKGYVIATSDATRDADKIYYEKKTINSVDYYVVAKEETAVGSLYEICDSEESGAINAYVQPVCLTDVPEIGGEPSNLETTTLCDGQKTYIQGILDAGESLEFSANYNHSAFIAIKNYLKGKLPCKVVFGGIGGSQGSASFDGYVNAKIGSFGVDEVVPMTIAITLASEIIFA